MGMTPYPGCVVLAETKGLYGFLIRAAQTLRWKKERRWNHAAIVSRVDQLGTWCIEMAWHCEEVRIDEVAPGGRVLVQDPPRGTDCTKAVAYARTKIGCRYGVLTILSIFVNLFTPKMLKVDFRSGRDSLICSALVARAWEHGGWDCDPADPFQITPAELAEVSLST